MEEKYKLLTSVLQELQDAGALNHLILAGSWCLYFYRILFSNSSEIPLLRTTDIDLLVPNPLKMHEEINLSEILRTLGFDLLFDYNTGLIKFVHPELEIQFITPEIGRGKDTPYSIKQLHINAEGLRYLDLFQTYNFEMTHKGITIRLPEPGAFILQKILASQERKDTEKKEKDLTAVKSIGEVCLNDKSRRQQLEVIFKSMPMSWQKKIHKLVKEVSPKLFDFFSSK